MATAAKSSRTAVNPAVILRPIVMGIETCGRSYRDGGDVRSAIAVELQRDPYLHLHWHTVSSTRFELPFDDGLKGRLFESGIRRFLDFGIHDVALLVDLERQRNNSRNSVSLKFIRIFRWHHADGHGRLGSGASNRYPAHRQHQGQ